MKKLLSFFWPQTKTIMSDHNGLLELTYVNGKKILDSKNANYSYGSLQKIMRKGLSHVDFSKIDKVLVLGLGGGCVIKELQKYNTKLTAVEWDKVVLDIAKVEFRIEENSHLKLVCADAYAYLLANQEVFDFVIVDLFVDDKVPTQFFQESFCKLILKTIGDQGQILFNLGLHQTLDVFRGVQCFFDQNNCETQMLHKVQKTNSLLLVKKMG